MKRPILTLPKKSDNKVVTIRNKQRRKPDAYVEVSEEQAQELKQEEKR